MSLKEIGENLNDDKYASLEDFIKDFAQMIKNAKQYNAEGSAVYNDALELEVLFLFEIEKLNSAHSLHSFDPSVISM